VDSQQDVVGHAMRRVLVVAGVIATTLMQSLDSTITNGFLDAQAQERG
jgi:hypothetical protein